MSDPTVSVIITTYNRPELLPRAIDSVINQTFGDFECIIVDDSSPKKEAKEIVDSYDDERLKYIRHIKNRGLSAARNTGLELANGEYVAFLDDDDEWLPQKLGKQVELFNKLGKDFAIVYCWMDYIKESNGEVAREYRPDYCGYIFPDTLDAQPIGAGSTLLVRIEAARQVNGFDEDLPRGIDGDFIRRICKEYKVDYVPETLVRYYIEHGQERITRDDYEGIQNHIHGQKTKFEKFEGELKNHPKKAANIYADIGYHHMVLSEWKRGTKYYWKAITTAPFSAKTHKWILRPIVQHIPNKLTAAYRILRRDGVEKFTNYILFRYLPRRLFNPLIMVSKEKAVPIPTGNGNWNIVKLNDMCVDRKMAAITTAHYLPHGSNAHRSLLRRIYNYDGFVSVEPNNVVVEIGAYIGTWTQIAAENAEQVLAIDPLAKADDSLRYNLSDLDNVRVVAMAAWHEQGRLEMNLSSVPNENSVFTPDALSTGTTMQIPCNTVPNIARKNDIESIDYLKIEAEGAEPEILRGALDDNMEITKIAIDAGSEGGKEGVLSEIISILESNDYRHKMKDDEIAWGDHIVFARKRK